MSEKEYYLKKAAETENDLQYFALIKQAQAAENLEVFERDVLPILQSSPLVKSVQMFENPFYRFILHDGSRFDYYPKGQRLFVLIKTPYKNCWIKSGALEYLKKLLLK